MNLSFSLFSFDPPCPPRLLCHLPNHHPCLLGTFTHSAYLPNHPQSGHFISPQQPTSCSQSALVATSLPKPQAIFLISESPSIVSRLLPATCPAAAGAGIPFIHCAEPRGKVKLALSRTRLVALCAISSLVFPSDFHINFTPRKLFFPHSIVVSSCVVCQLSNPSSGLFPFRRISSRVLQSTCVSGAFSVVEI